MASACNDVCRHMCCLLLSPGKSYGKEAEWSDSTAEEISLWQGMLDRANSWVEGTLLLRPNMDYRKKPQ